MTMFLCTSMVLSATQVVSSLTSLSAECSYSKRVGMTNTEFEPATHSQSTHPESLSSAPPRSPLPSVAISGEGYPVNKQVPSPLFGDSIGKTTWDNFEPLASWQAPPSLADLAGARIFTPTVDLPHNQSQSDFLPLPERPGPVLRTQQKGSKSYREIERRYTCRWNGCTKAYGTLNHLNDHVSLQGHGPKRRSSGKFLIIMDLCQSHSKAYANQNSNRGIIYHCRTSTVLKGRPR